MNSTADSAIQRRAGLFREMHERPGILLLANPWDAGSACLLENAGFKALATTSAGLAFSLGRRDGDGGVTADEAFEHVRELIAATSVPLTADLENGFGASPAAVAATIRRAGAVGLAGASIEDATYDEASPLYERSLAVERIQAAVEAARALPYPFVLTARAENFIRGQANLEDTLWRLTEYEKAGADVLYAPGLPDESALRLVCGALTRPFNYVAGVRGPRFTISQLQAIGVRRVTLGTSLARFALHATLSVARTLLDQGTFDWVEGLPSVVDFNQLIDPR